MFVLIRSLCCGLGLFLVSIVTAPLSAQQILEIEQDYPAIRVEQVVAGLGIPWGMAFLSPDQLLLTERAGTVRLLDTENGSTVKLSGTPKVVAEGRMTQPEADAFAAVWKERAASAGSYLQTPTALDLILTRL